MAENPLSQTLVSDHPDTGHDFPDCDIAVIGAGIAGLSAGCYAQLNGYNTQIFELHTLPGGLCTSWKRGGYTIDGCIHWLVGTSPDSSFNQIWQELDVLPGRQIVDHEEFVRVRGPNGKTLIIYTDIDRLERHLKELSPMDADLISEMASAVRRLARFEPPIGKPRELYSALDGLKMLPGMLPVMGTMNKYKTQTMEQFWVRFQDPFLRDAFSMLFGLPNMSLLGFLFTLAYLHNRNAGYPLGGSLGMALAIEHYYCKLGGQIHYKARVEEILVEAGRAVGVRLEDGRVCRAKRVISAADGYSTIYKMLGGKYVNAEIDRIYREMPIFEPFIQVSFGINRDLSAEPHSTIFMLKEPVTIAGTPRRELKLRHYCYDPHLAPRGKSVINVLFGSNYAYWIEFLGDDERYEAEKKQVAIAVIEQLETFYPGLGSDIEMVDVATPLTYERYTGNWQGSFEGWLLTPEAFQMSMTGSGIPKTLPGLENFHMIGQWVEPGGGVPTAAMSARNMLQILCNKDGKAFRSRN
jgi:phytoene dehydrogenase-like protein